MPASKKLEPSAVNGVAPCSGYSEKLIKNIFSILLGSSDDFRYTGAVQQELGEQMVLVCAVFLNKVRDNWVATL